jgi:hypothetical protein
MGALNASGYGTTAWYGKVRRAHQVAWERANGMAIPAGLWVLHSCDNRWCVNPQHLRLGTAADNSRDAVTRVRLSFGERNHYAKITAAQVRQIRESNEPAAVVAATHGISKKYIWEIRTRKTWRHLDAQRAGRSTLDGDLRIIEVPE